VRQPSGRGLAAAIDLRTPAGLRTSGGLKWTAYPGALGAWVAEMDCGLAPPVKAALEDAVRRELTGYVPRQLRDELCVATSEFVSQRYGWTIDPAQVFGIPDVVTALNDVLTFWSEPGGAVIVPTPAYMPFPHLPLNYGRRVIELPMRRTADGWTLDLNDLDAAFNDGGRLLILCNPHNPIGKVYGHRELLGICEVVEDHDGQVFADEIHAPLVFDAPARRHIPYASLNAVAAAHTVTAFSASKAFNVAGLKCAQMVLTNPVQLAWRQAHDLDQEPGVLGVAANIAAYRQGWDWLAEVLAYLDINRHLLVQLVAQVLPGVKMRQPEGTYLAWLDVSALDLGDSPAAFFRDWAGVALTEGSECGQAGRGCVRLNFATPTRVLRQMIDQMAGALTAAGV